MKAGPPRGRAGLLALALAVSLAGCAGKKSVDARTTAMLSAQGIFREGMDRLSRRRLTQAIESFGRIQYTPDSIERIEPLARLAVADATFYQETDLSLIDAHALYVDFVTLYGDHPLAPYAQTQAGMCSLKQVNHPTRDQTLTLQAIADLEQVERRYPASDYAFAARSLLRKARANLAESEYRVGRFYLKRKSPLAAAERFQHVLDDYPDFPETDKVLYALGRTLIALDNPVRARLYLDRLLADYPDGEYAAEARALIGDIEASAGGDAETPLQSTLR